MKFFSSLLLRNALVAVIAVSVTVPLVSCKKGDEGAASSDVSYYTCTMHPSVKSQDPKAKCPICSMDLVPVKKVRAASSDVGYYTCTMHPSVKSQDPKAKCPICSMDLVLVKKVKAASSDVSYYTCT